MEFLEYIKPRYDIPYSCCYCIFRLNGCLKIPYLSIAVWDESLTLYSLNGWTRGGVNPSIKLFVTNHIDVEQQVFLKWHLASAKKLFAAVIQFVKHFF